jgi:hypothetical protein
MSPESRSAAVARTASSVRPGWVVVATKVPP